MSTETLLDRRKDFRDGLCRDPYELTRWLAYADWLDEQEPGRVKCGACGGDGYVMTSDKHGYAEYSMQCRSCDGGTVPDTSDADLAEWIRLHARPGPWAGNDPREIELLGRRGAEWRRAACPACEGKGRIVRRGAGGQSSEVLNPLCPTCGGTGDLFKTPSPRSGVSGYNLNHRTHTVLRPWAPGMSVSCTLAELEESWRVAPSRPRTDELRPSPWAEAVVRNTVVTRFVVTDRRPGRVPNTSWGWYREGQIPESALPDYLLSLLDPMYPTAGAAADALALAACRVVRKAVYGG